VKGLLKIALIGFVGFMVLAMAQEWEVFHAAWFGERSSATGLSEDEQKAAADTVHLMLTVIGHLYASSGDERFAERLPAAPGVVEEVLADIDYLTRNHRLQQMTLERLEILSIDPTGAGEVEIRTRERWEVRIQQIDGRGAAEPPRSLTSHGKYLLVTSGRGWRVERWEIDDPASDPGAAPA